MKAYPDGKCVYGYMLICDSCKVSGYIPKHVDLTKPITNPPAVGKKQPCELCGKEHVLQNP